MQRSIVSIVIGLSLVLGVLFFLPSLIPQKAQKTQTSVEQLKAYVEAGKCVEKGQLDEALALIKAHEEQILAQSVMGKKWVGLLIEVSERKKDLSQLEHLFKRFPEQFIFYEKASLALAERLLDTNDLSTYGKLRQLWLYSEGEKASWLHLDADRLLLKNKREKAITLLNMKSLRGKEEVKRLIRLGLLHIHSDLKMAWDFFHKAYLLDPKNPDIHTYRAQILEQAGKEDYALKEWQQAQKFSDHNPFVKDRVAGHFLVQGDEKMAFKSWEEALSQPTNDEVWLRALFWSRVIEPIDFEWHTTPVPHGVFNPVVRYLVELGPTKLWDAERFETFQEADYFRAHSQELFWLELMGNLKEKQEEVAFDCLVFNPFSQNSWDPQLEQVVTQLLSFRKDSRFIAHANQHITEGAHSGTLKREILMAMAGAMTPEREALFLSDEVFSLAFIEAGWREAALYLHPLCEVSSELPAMVATKTLDLLKQARSKIEVDRFIALQKDPSALILQLAEGYLAEQRQREGILELARIAEENSDAGYRAAWLMSLLCIEQEKYDVAKKTIINHPLLVHDVKGQEILARVALLQNQLLEADQIYESLEHCSSEAKSYLVRKAFLEGDWERAKLLTEELIDLFPDNEQFQKNLKKIDDKLAQNRLG